MAQECETEKYQGDNEQAQRQQDVVAPTAGLRCIDLSLHSLNPLTL